MGANIFTDYSIWQLIAFFFIYSFIGWAQECIVVLVQCKKLTNRGFLNGPVCPVYGCGAMVILLCGMPFSNNFVLIFFAGIIGTTALELFTGFVMEKMFKTKWWDYSNQKFNFKGYICLSSSLCWGVLSIVLTKLLHPYVVVKIIEKIHQPLLMYVCLGLIAFFIGDMIISFFAAVSMTRIIAAAGKLKEQMTEMSRQLSDTIESNISTIRTDMQKSLHKAQLDYEQLISGGSIRMKRLLKAFPRIKSHKFNDALTDLRTRLLRIKKGKSNEGNLE